MVVQSKAFGANIFIRNFLRTTLHRRFPCFQEKNRVFPQNKDTNLWKECKSFSTEAEQVSGVVLYGSFYILSHNIRDYQSTIARPFKCMRNTEVRHTGHWKLYVPSNYAAGTFFARRIQVKLLKISPINFQDSMVGSNYCYIWIAGKISSSICVKMFISLWHVGIAVASSLLW